MRYSTGVLSAFCRSTAGGGIAVDRFVLGGASKRGWTAWTTAAVDKRVAAVVPVVIDLLNIETSFEHHYRAYSFWAPAIAAYQASGIMRWAGTAELASLLKIEDPYSYRDRLSIRFASRVAHPTKPACRCCRNRRTAGSCSRPIAIS